MLVSEFRRLSRLARGRQQAVVDALQALAITAHVECGTAQLRPGQDARLLQVFLRQVQRDLGAADLAVVLVAQEQRHLQGNAEAVAAALRIAGAGRVMLGLHADGNVARARGQRQLVCGRGRRHPCLRRHHVGPPRDGRIAGRAGRPGLRQRAGGNHGRPAIGQRQLRLAAVDARQQSQRLARPRDLATRLQGVIAGAQRFNLQPRHVGRRQVSRLALRLRHLDGALVQLRRLVEDGLALARSQRIVIRLADGKAQLAPRLAHVLARALFLV